MKGHKFLFTMFLGLLYSCSQTNQKADGAPTKIEITDSKTVTSNSASEKFYFVERGHYNSKNYSLIVKSTYLLADTLKYDSSYYCQGNYLYILNETDKSTDSIELAEGCGDGIIIQDVTHQLHFKIPMFNVSSPGGSDTYTSEFIEYKNGSLKKLFEINDYNPAELKRKDEHTLTGFVKGRDEVVSNFEDYPVTVSLNDYSVKIERPSKQEIGYTTVALSDFDGYQITGDLKSLYIIKKGTTVFIDSINRKTNIVRLTIKDTVVIYVPVSKIKDKVQVNDAG